jgi:hypothetical protein
MEKAIQQFGHQWLEGTEHVHDGREPVFEYALSGEILAMTRVFASDAPDVLATKGAPEPWPTCATWTPRGWAPCAPGGGAGRARPARAGRGAGAGGARRCANSARLAAQPARLRL